MNQIMARYYPLFEEYQALREQLLERLTDEDLGFSPGGANPPLGSLCREIGEVEQAYIDSFKTFTLEFSYRAGDPQLGRSVSRLQAWYADLDEALRAAVAGFSDEALQSQLIDRGPDFQVPIQVNLSIYNEALLIFYGKVMVYLKAMGVEAPRRWKAWIA